MPGAPGWYPGRCKDCAATAPKGTSRCDGCRAAHNAREAARRAERRTAGKCVVCGKAAVKIDGKPLRTCKAHREYFRARAAGE